MSASKVASKKAISDVVGKKLQELKRFNGVRITVGVHDEEGAARRGKVSLKQIATWMEFGTGRIPARSFIRGYQEEKSAGIIELFKRLAESVATGKLTAEQAAERAGLVLVGGMQARIARGIAPANAPRTIARKGSSTPLIDTGQLRASITFRVKLPAKPVRRGGSAKKGSGKRKARGLAKRLAKAGKAFRAKGAKLFKKAAKLGARRGKAIAKASSKIYRKSARVLARTRKKTADALYRYSVTPRRR